MEKKSCTKGACGLAAGRPNFLRGEGCKGNTAHAPAPPRAPKRSAGHRCQRARKAPRFCCISAIVLRLWQEWQRLWRLLRSVNTASLRGAAGCGPLPWPASGLRAGHTAKTAREGAVGPQVLRPLWSQVHPVPGLGRIAAAVLGAVEITIAASYQGRTPRMSAWTQRLLCHGLSPPGKTKSRHRRLLHRKIIGTGLSKALAMFDIHEIFCLCNYGTRESAAGAGLRAGLLVRDAVAVGADIPSLLYGQFNTFIARLQRVSLTFV